MEIQNILNYYYFIYVETCSVLSALRANIYCSKQLIETRIKSFEPEVYEIAKLNLFED